MAKRSLEDFFDALRSNQQANREIFPEWYAIIVRIDDCFVRCGLIEPKSSLAGVFFIRCQYAFKAAAGMALAGQPEVFPILRSLLEYAGYCLVMSETPALERVFVLRHAGEAELKEQKKAFQISAVREAMARHDTNLATFYEEMYQRTIDFGAHPNPYAIFTTKTWDHQTMIHTLKSTGQIGLAALHVLKCVFKPKFELLDIHREMEALANTGLL